MMQKWCRQSETNCTRSKNSLKLFLITSNNSQEIKLNLIRFLMNNNNWIDIRSTYLLHKNKLYNKISLHKINLIT